MGQDTIEVQGDVLDEACPTAVLYRCFVEFQNGWTLICVIIMLLSQPTHSGGWGFAYCLTCD